MKRLIRFCLGFIFPGLIACCGCSPSLESETRATQNAMDNAQSYNAEQLAPADWEAAMATWKRAQTAIAQGQSTRDYLHEAKSQFKKAALLADANGKAMAKEILDMQKSINERYLTIKAALKNGKPNSKIQQELAPIMQEVALNSSSIENLNMNWEYVKAKAMAQDTLKKIESAELIMAGKKQNR
jgi:hypothetical protein